MQKFCGRRRRLALAVSSSLALALPSLAIGQLVAFPGAIGFGSSATGGRGGNVAVVTNLNASGAGSFAAAVTTPNTVVVFAVGGYVDLDGGEIAVANNVTIEGQTAPGMGIGFLDGEISFSSSSNDIVRDIRIRQGDGVGQASGGTDTGKASIEMDGGNNIILDHVSEQFGEWDSVDLTNSTNVTIQNSMMTDAIGQQFGIHAQSDSNMTYAYNVIANNHNRNPDIENTGSAQFINNIVYDTQAGFTSGSTGGTRQEDMVGNYFIAGPTGTSNLPFYQVNGSDEIYASGNMVDTNRNGQLDGSAFSASGSGATVESNPWFASTSTIPTFSATGAYNYDTTFAGDSLSRDTLDGLDIGQVESLGTSGGTTAKGDFLYTHPYQDGLANNGYGVITGGTAPTSSANDGIPDTWATTRGVGTWATLHGTTTSNPAFAIVRDPLGYTEIEDYANALADQFVSQTWSAPSGNWSTAANWNSAAPGIFQQALIRGTGAADGSVTLNTAGNFAESVSIGGNGLAAGEQLTVSGGSLTVEDTIFVGDQNNGALTITAGTVAASNVQLGDTAYNSSGVATNYTGTLNLSGGTLMLQQLVLGAGTPDNWNTGGVWNWSGGGTLEAAGPLNVNAPATLGSGGGIVNTNGFNGAISSMLSGIGGLTKTGTGTLTLSAANQYLGNTTVNAGVLDVTGSLLNNGSANVFIAADPTGSTLLIRKTSAGASYDGFGSSVTSDLQSRADIVSGRNSTNNSNGETITMAWRQRLSSEQPDLISDVITITGMANSGTTGTGQTDPFALQMNFTTSEFSPSGPQSEQNAASVGALHLDWLNPNGGGSGVSEWVNAVNGNYTTGLNGDVFTDVESSWSTFAALHDITDSNLANFLGSWGVDTTDNDVWAVVDHNSTFGAYLDTANVPEPCSGATIIFALSALLCRRRRSRI